ncbi:GNAT family N-acetyltransferase [Halovenus rubra]|uniref:GNAT family N-acetyltransferase n=2 Tax=Halovenus rubra TaxID=869890 RepID=A0ABD5X2T5_9EURY|nr:GNAT family N-acetyltransferase [Halovenus rubra]
MTSITKPKFSHDGRSDIYDYVERHGAMEPEAVREAVNMEHRAFGHHVAILKRDQVLEKSNGKLRVAFEGGAEEEYSTEAVSFTIRQAREEDLTGLVGAIREAIGGGKYVRAETVADVVDNEGVLLRHNKIEARIFFVACVDSDVVGWVHLKHVDLDKLRHTAQLTVGVLDQYRGKGIGSHLLERGLNWAAQQEFEKIENALPATNEQAIEFLKSRDFEVDAVREDHYKLNGEYVDEVMMMKQL